jgi:tight adherence protein B
MLIAALCWLGAAVLAGGSARRRLRRLLPGVRSLAGRLADLLLAALSERRDAPDVGAFCDAVAAELRCGTPADRALVLAEGAALVPRGAAAAAIGEPIAEALAADARQARSAALAAVAACWSAAADGGASLAGGLDRAAGLARAEQRISADLATETAGPRATARTLAALPLVGAGLGQLLGADPLAWLIGTPAGRVCLAAGAVLQAVGLLWSRRIIAKAQPRPLVGRP